MRRRERTGRIGKRVSTARGVQVEDSTNTDHICSWPSTAGSWPLRTMNCELRTVSCSYGSAAMATAPTGSVPVSD